MSPADVPVIAVFVLMLAGAIGLGAYVATSPARPRPTDDDGGLDAHFSAYWWL